MAEAGQEYTLREGMIFYGLIDGTEGKFEEVAVW